MSDQKRQEFPSGIPEGLLLGFVVGVALIVPCVAGYSYLQPPIQTHYLKTYIATSMHHRKREKPKQFLLRVRATGKPEEMSIASARACTNHDAFVTLAMGEEALDAAFPCVLTSRSKPVAEWLRNAVYERQSMTEFLQVPLIVWGCCLLACLIAGGVHDTRKKKRLIDGIQVRGPEVVTRAEFNRRVKGDGFPIVLDNPRTFGEWWKGHEGKALRIRLKDENKNIICMSDPGGGKTSVMMQILDEVERRG